MILQRYIDRGYLTTTKAEQLELDPFQSNILNSETMSQLIFANFISVDEVLQLSLREQSNLKLHSICRLITNGLITIKDALAFAAKQRMILGSEKICDLIIAEKMTVDQVLQLTLEQRITLESQAIYELISEGKLMANQALKLDESERRVLESNSIYQLIHKEFVTVDQALSFSLRQRVLLESREVFQLIIDSLTNSVITNDEVFPLTLNREQILSSERIRSLIIANKITIRQALQLDISQQTILDAEAIYTLVSADKIDIDNALDLTPEEQRILKLEGVHHLIMMDRITVRDALEFTPHEQEILQFPTINMLISNGILDVNLALMLNEEELQFFEFIDDDTIERMLNGDLNLDNIFAGDEEGEQVNDLNGAQSTHTASVHRSISESAQKLMALYGGDLTDQVLVATFKDIKAYLDALDEDSKTTAAKSAFRRLTAENDSFIDPVSNVSTKQMLALAWIAIHDKSKCLGTLEDAQMLFFDGLFEIQRGYNLSPAGVDLGGRDNPICAAGTFNKLIEKLQGVHPSCKVLFISRELASLKLKRVVVEESADYLNNIPLETTKDLNGFNDLLGQINEDGLRAVHGCQTVYDYIKDKVSERMFEEFSPLYRDKDDPNFAEMVDGGEWAELPQVEIQHRLSVLPAYQDYCSRHILVSPTLLFQQMADRVLWENRNDSAEHRQAFDAKFGVLLAKDHGFDMT